MNRSARKGMQVRGFTLLEAIVALTIIGVALVPIMTFISQMTNGLMRAAESNERSLAQRAAMELLEPLNPLDQPIGEDKLGDLMVRWQTETLVPPNKEPLLGSRMPNYSFGFYKVTVSVERADRGQWFTFDMRKAGYKRFGNPMVGLPQ